MEYRFPVTVSGLEFQGETIVDGMGEVCVPGVITGLAVVVGPLGIVETAQRRPQQETAGEAPLLPPIRVVAVIGRAILIPVDSACIGSGGSYECSRCTIECGIVHPQVL